MSSLEIAGEVANPGKVNFKDLPLHSVVVKETLLDGKKDKFIGAYRYDGYSLYDILNQTVLKKANEAEFPPIIDLYVEVENASGEKVIFSWGEIYYPIHRHEILIASQVARIVPSKTKDLWPLPTDSRVVAAADLLTHRNISNPAKITVKSYARKYNIFKDMNPMISEKFSIYKNNELVEEVNEISTDMTMMTYPTVFYGRGRGIHGTTPFSGVLLKNMLLRDFQMNEKTLRTGIFSIAGLDGYHAVFTYSEIMNRNDQAEFLVVISRNDYESGIYQVFPAPDFFSDRAIKAIESIRFENL
jgi:hypothetical protein